MKTSPRSLIWTTTLAGFLGLLVTGCGKPQDPMVTTPPASTSVGTVIDDSVLTTSVKAALLADPEVKSFDIKVETRKGEVQLSGFVDNQAQIERAIAVTRAVANVKGVDNKVALKGAPRTVGVKVDDGIVTTQVKAALLADEKVKAIDIAVVTRSGEVQLSGFVDSQMQMDRAILVARGIEGVGNVTNQMSLKK